MAFSPDEGMSRPFKDLDRLLKQKKVSLKGDPPRRSPRAAEPVLSPTQEAELFKTAMADVTPLKSNHRRQAPKQRSSEAPVQGDEESETVGSLSRLVATGEGFIVADTDEYMEATAPGVDREIARQLHSGRYSVQDHVDLHGLTAVEADEVLHTFIHKVIREGKRAVLVVHGRGLTSPGEPVLKQRVFLWLTRGPLRKHVIALSSARSCDGGAGATYVLLRRRPFTKRMRKTASSTSDN